MADKTKQRIDLRFVAPEDWVDYLNQGGILSDALDLDAEQLEAIYILAYQKYQSANYEDAKSLFQLLCYCNHHEAKYFLALGATRQALEEYELAGETFSIAALAHPRDPRFPFYAAQCQLALGNLREAGSGFEMAANCSSLDGPHKILHEQAQRQVALLKAKLNVHPPLKETQP